MPHRPDNRLEDIVTLESKNGAVGLCCEHPMDAEFVEALSGTLNEWSSAHDEDAYRSLQVGAIPHGLRSE